MHLVLGLGNPGPKYAGTRHNVGFLVVDRLADRWRAPLDTEKFQSVLGKGRFDGATVVLAKPQTYMNRSGQAAATLRGFYKIPDEQIVVIHDDVDLPFGTVRVKRDGGHGGHNGLRDLKQRLGSGDFRRVRVGVSRPPPRWDTADYVLSSWSAEQQEHLDEVVDGAAEAVEAVLRDGVQSAMNEFNQRSRTVVDAPQAGDRAGS